MTWWYGEITKEMTTEILEELRVFSHYLIHKNINGIIKGNPTGPVFRHHENHKEYAIEPEGVIIHSSQTQTVWDTVRMIANKSLKSHFIISSHPCTWGKYLRELPTTIIMPMDPDMESAILSRKVSIFAAMCFLPDDLENADMVIPFSHINLYRYDLNITDESPDIEFWIMNPEKCLSPFIISSFVITMNLVVNSF